MLEVKKGLDALSFPPRREDLGKHFEQIHSFLYRKARSIVHNHDDAEDIASCAFIRLLNSTSCHSTCVAQYHGFMARTVINIALNHIRDESHSPKTLSIDEGFWDNIPDTTEERDCTLIELYHGMKNYIQDRLEKEPGNITWRILWERLIEDVSTEDLARDCEIPIGTIKSRTSRGLDKIRRHFET